MDAVRAINAFATGGVAPDRTLLLRIDAATRRTRLAGRSGAADRLELEDEAFFERVVAAYDELARAEPGRWAVLDASGPADGVLRAAHAALADLADLAGP